ncbi:MAG: hypothetical protein IPM35_38310 [Myxococcales bacterium]|nr:hypothetical protein [Myxococcales bacterium]
MRRRLACAALLPMVLACATRESGPEPARTAVVVPSASAEPERDEATPLAAPARQPPLSDCRAPADQNLEEAKREFQRGVEAMVNDQPETAAELFLLSYQRTCNPALLYNLGVVREKLGDLAGAAEAFEVYLSREPASFRTDEVKRRIQQLRAQ